MVNKGRNNRRSLRRNKIKDKKRKTALKLVGVNAAGLSSKFKSFDNMLTTLSPEVFFVEESKMRRPGKIKTKASENYIIYELIRKNKGGGGLAIGVDKNLKPVWVDEGDDDVEVLIVEARADDFKFCCEKIDKKTNFVVKKLTRKQISGQG